jgi:hypothetical protein
MSMRTNRRTKGKFRVSPRADWSKAAREWVDDKTNYLIYNEGMPAEQAYAVAISLAREKGYKIPERKK